MSAKTNDWWASAACAGMSPLFDDDVLDFEPEGSGRAYHRSRTPAQNRAERAAVQICKTCPVRVECLEDAIKHGDEWTVRGGLTALERRALMRTRGMRVSPARDLSRALDEAVLRLRRQQAEALQPEEAW